jgi:MT0933-like antitoxin protein
MGVLEKVKQLFGQAKDKATDVAGDVAEKAGDAASKAGEVAAKGVDKAAEGVDKATGGRFHDQIENVSNKVEGVLDKDKNEDPGSPKS